MNSSARQRPPTWRERLLNYAAVTVIAALVWSWASSETRQVGEAEMKLLFTPSSPQSQSVGPTEPVSVRVNFIGSKAAVDHAVDAVRGRTLTVTVGTCGIPNSIGGHEVALAKVVGAMSVVESTGARVRSTQPAFATITIDSTGK
jgi:hypothetical protein